MHLQCLVCGYNKKLRPVINPQTNKPEWYECKGTHATERKCKSCGNQFQQKTGSFCDTCIRTGKWKRVNKNKKTRKPRRVRPGRS